MNFSDQATCQVVLLKCLGGSKLSLFAVLKFTFETLFMLTFIPFSFWIILCGKKISEAGIWTKAIIPVLREMEFQ